MWKRSLEQLKKLGIFAIALCLHIDVFANTDLTKAEKAVRLRQYTTAFNFYLSAARAGNPEAQYQVANMYGSGLGTPKNEKNMQFWLEKSSAARWPAAQFSLGIQLQTTNPTQSEQLIQAAAQQEYQPAVLYIRRGISESSKNTNTEVSKVGQWFWAIKQDNIELAKTLLKELGTTESKDEHGNTALFYAVEYGNKDVMNWLIKSKADVNHTNTFGETALFHAISKNEKNLFFALANKTKQLNQALPNGDNLLHFSLRRKRFDWINAILQFPININAKNEAKETPLDLAEFYKQKNIVSAMRAKGATNGPNGERFFAGGGAGKKFRKSLDNFSGNIGVNEAANIIISGNNQLLPKALSKIKGEINTPLDDGQTLAGLAILHSNTSGLNILIKKGAKLPANALHLASAESKAEMIDALITLGEKPLSSNQDGRDALGIAIVQGRLDIVQHLLTYLSTIKGKTSKLTLDKHLIEAAKINNTKITLALLNTTNTINPNIQDSAGRTALWYAASHGNMEIVSLLLSKGFSENKQDSTGLTPLFASIQANCDACIHLLANETTINLASPSGETPLMAAVDSKNATIVEALLSKGAEVNHRNLSGNSALIAAVEIDNKELIKLLLNAGGSPTRKNNFGLSALDIAERNASASLEDLREASKIKLF